MHKNQSVTIDLDRHKRFYNILVYDAEQYRGGKWGISYAGSRDYGDENGNPN